MRYVYLLIIVLFTTTSLVASKRSEAILDDMSSAIDKLGSYEVSFEIEGGVAADVGGVYIVDRDLYKLEISNHEIYGDDKYRYTVDKSLREVVKESIDSSLSLLVANPARAFRALNRNFESEIVEQQGEGNICVHLTPRRENDIVDSTLIEIDPATKLPTLVSYTSAGETITIRILSFVASPISLLPLDDMELPDGYDIIDVR